MKPFRLLKVLANRVAGRQGFPTPFPLAEAEARLRPQGSLFRSLPPLNLDLEDALPQPPVPTLKTPVGAGTVEGVNAGVAAALAVLSVWALERFAGPLDGEVKAAMLTLGTVVVAGVMKAWRKRSENWKLAIAQQEAAMLAKTFRPED